MPVSWQMGPESSTAMSMLDKIMSNACEDCVSGVSSVAAIDIAARTSGGRLGDVSVISSSKLPAGNSISLPPQTNYFTLLRAGGPERSFDLKSYPVSENRTLLIAKRSFKFQGPISERCSGDMFPATPNTLKP